MPVRINNKTKIPKSKEDQKALLMQCVKVKEDCQNRVEKKKQSLVKKSNLNMVAKNAIEVRDVKILGSYLEISTNHQNGNENSKKTKKLKDGFKRMINTGKVDKKKIKSRDHSAKCTGKQIKEDVKKIDICNRLITKLMKKHKIPLGIDDSDVMPTARVVGVVPAIVINEDTLNLIGDATAIPAISVIPAIPAIPVIPAIPAIPVIPADAGEVFMQYNAEQKKPMSLDEVKLRLQEKLSGRKSVGAEPESPGVLLAWADDKWDPHVQETIDLLVEAGKLKQEDLNARVLNILKSMQRDLTNMCLYKVQEEMHPISDINAFLVKHATHTKKLFNISDTESSSDESVDNMSGSDEENGDDGEGIEGQADSEEEENDYMSDS